MIIKTFKDKTHVSLIKIQQHSEGIYQLALHSLRLLRLKMYLWSKRRGNEQTEKGEPLTVFNKNFDSQTNKPLPEEASSVEAEDSSVCKHREQDDLT